MADRHTTEKLLEGERLSGKVTLFAKVTILPGDELPYHEHHGETEVYHILSGEGIYQDNNKTYPMQAGMTTFCEDGSGDCIMRFYETRGEDTKAHIVCESFNADFEAEFGHNEIKTFRISKDGNVKETNFLEGIV